MRAVVIQIFMGRRKIKSRFMVLNVLFCIFLHIFKSFEHIFKIIVVYAGKMGKI